MTRGQKKTISRSRVVLSQVLACVALNVLLIGLGMSISFVTMVLPEVLDAKEGLTMNQSQASWFGSMAFLCQPLGSIFSGLILDYFGRKKALFLVNIPHLIAWLLMYFAWDVPSLFLANALLGIGTGIMEAPSVTYVGEVSDPSVRGILTTLTNCFTSIGMFIAYLLGTVVSWRQAALVSLTVPLTTMALVLFVPETPIWLISKGRQKEALHSLCRLRGWAQPEHVQDEFNQLIEYNNAYKECVICSEERTPEGQPCEHSNYNIFKKTYLKYKYVFFVKETLRPFGLVMAYFFFHTMSGLIPVRPNMVNLCIALGMKFDPKAIVVTVGVVYILMNLISAAVVKSIGKRKLVLISLFATACCSLAISIYAGVNLPFNVFSYEPNTFPEQKEFLPIILFMLLVSFTSTGIPWVLLSEVFPFRSRGMATGLAAALSYIIFFLASKTNYNLESSFHIHGTFLLYSIIGFIGTVYLYFFLPETERKTLVEIEAYYKGNQKIFADDFFINAFKKKNGKNNDVDCPMLVTCSSL
ncbi:facilitated trehalose transporter Tret1-like [Maniola hyperantus]|uniref:facilitated trehalose transporter Tret1-like n=1 Tax=Aphantopus hyperantus TaxID=2795564 RepID=UPI0015695449|nr:facilitated trehalose transporter Tret1-like [Maniola hyperantus]XP_034835778.1 facilitated trehalose transporter Tret1-like [Maniola hyperantus]XP_034835779.1 facilitated trehalose transporter Tret1-like [Maniola hyperantus]